MFKHYLVIILLCLYIHKDTKSKDIITFESVEQDSILYREIKKKYNF